MDRYKSTIGRELKRNLGQRGYRPKQAHEFSQARLRACENGSRIAKDTGVFVEAKFAETWSPGQIAGYLKANSKPTVSHESIYQRIYADKRAGGPCIALCAAKRLAENAMVADASDAAPFPIKCRLSCDRRWSMHGNVLATGKAIWSSARVSRRRV